MALSPTLPKRSQTDYHFIGEELIENATFCCLFHEITWSTLRDIVDLVSRNNGPKQRFLDAQYANLFMTSLQVNNKLHLSHPNI
jgi:hypothetical protein